ncbi:UDP-GlcNAc:betaGal beta-1,3-N-acetylglucosaminyltransferase 8 [Rhinatrema bivittatum]|uniref:UDP-GlcNAc:betaGal beta-1,3-N-acetylglucosaminyltransferase 8 n=1 Tax=Rhinatrema bivittatum TaxID=194408 RepID=UPI001129FF9B|nr:UDP-GlcNAc:betaGal beta-1,3-N-acetylglucosaminyltransferase 8 [Rhinatrema bivittatum]
MKLFIDWSSDDLLPWSEPSLHRSKLEWKLSSINKLSSVGTEGNLFEDDEFRTLLLNLSQELREKIPMINTYWNKKQHEMFQRLESGVNVSTVCRANTNVNLEISNFESYPKLFKQFLVYSNCRWFPLVINQPKKCTGNQTFLLFAIKSAPQNFINRQTIRKTWGRETVYGDLWVRTVFLLGMKGEYDPDLQHLLLFEGQQFQDILQWDFHDSFFNLTLKDNLFLKWTMDYCQDAHFIFKGDDDVFANTMAIVNYLHSLKSPVAETLYMGHIVSKAVPFREYKSKYYIPESYYSGPYPAYAGGGGFIFSGHLAKWLYLVSHYIVFYPIDDVYTGLCFKALEIEPMVHSQFQTFDIAAKNRDNPCVHKTLLLVHQRSPQQTLRLWKLLQDPELSC